MKTETLTEVLRRYADPLFPVVECLAVVEEDGVRQYLSVHEACGIAADWLERRDIDGLKFRALVAGMKQRGMQGLYRSLMNEDIPS